MIYTCKVCKIIVYLQHDKHLKLNKMKIKNEVYNAIDENKGLKSVLVFNYRFSNNITHKIHLVSYCFDIFTIKDYGNYLKGRWNIKQKELEKLNK